MTPVRITAIAAMLLASIANADEMLDLADVNGDGYVSLYELRAAYFANAEFNRRIEQSFADYDTDGDGLISEAERQARRTEVEATAATAATAGSVSTGAAVEDTRVVESNDPPPEASNAATATAATLPSAGGLSRSEAWIQRIDADRSGGASMKELLASGEGDQWFTKKTFENADENDDGDLDSIELEVFLQSLERRRR